MTVSSPVLVRERSDDRVSIRLFQSQHNEAPANNHRRGKDDPEGSSATREHDVRNSVKGRRVGVLDVSLAAKLGALNDQVPAVPPASPPTLCTFSPTLVRLSRLRSRR